MTTADLIKKREEEKNNPQLNATSPLVGAPKPAEGVNMAEARMLGNTPQVDVTTTKPNLNTPLYDAGVSLANVAKDAAINKSTTITSPEYEKFRNEVIGAQQFGVETEEQKKARERRDFIKQGLTGFTDGLTALANLYYTTKWAPNQKQTYQLPALQQQLYKERLERDKKLENFRAWQRAKAEKDADRAYQEGVRKEQQAREDALRAKIWEREDKKAAQNQANLDRAFDYKVEQDALDRETTAKQQEEASKQFWASFGLQKDRLNQKASSSSSSVMHSKNGISILNTKNGFLDVDWKKVDPIAKNQLYNAIPKEIRDKYPLKETEYGEYNEKYATSQMNAAIAEAAITDERIAKWLVDSKAASYQQQEINPIHSNTQSSGTQQASGNSGATDFSKQKRGGGQAKPFDLSQYEIPSSGGAQQTTMANVTPASTKGAPSDAQPTQEDKPKPEGKDRYKAMVISDRNEAEAERKAKEERIRKATEKEPTP